jgi:hypothetical protein
MAVNDHHEYAAAARMTNEVDLVRELGHSTDYKPCRPTTYDDSPNAPNGGEVGTHDMGLVCHPTYDDENSQVGGQGGGLEDHEELDLLVDAAQGGCVGVCDKFDQIIVHAPHFWVETVPPDKEAQTQLQNNLESQYKGLDWIPLNLLEEIDAFFPCLSD